MTQATKLQPTSVYLERMLKQQKRLIEARSLNDIVEAKLAQVQIRKNLTLHQRAFKEQKQ